MSVWMPSPSFFIPSTRRVYAARLQGRERLERAVGEHRRAQVDDKAAELVRAAGHDALAGGSLADVDGRILAPADEERLAHDGLHDLVRARQGVVESVHGI